MTPRSGSAWFGGDKKSLILEIPSLVSKFLK